MHSGLVVGHGDHLRQVEPKPQEHQEKKNDRGGSQQKVKRRIRRIGIGFDAVVDSAANRNENSDGDEGEQQVNQEADEAPEMVSAGFEERGGGGLGVEHIGCQNAAGGENHENREDYRIVKDGRTGGFERGIGLDDQLEHRRDIEAVHKTFGSQAVVEHRSRVLDHSAGSKTREDE